MLEIDEYIVNVLKTNSDISTYLGSDENDSRIYSWSPGFDIKFTSTQKAAIFYKENKSPQPLNYSFPSQRGDKYYYFQIASPSKTLTKSIVEKMDEILCPIETPSGFSTDNWRVLEARNNGESEGEIKGSSGKILYIRNFSILLNGILRKTFNSP